MKVKIVKTYSVQFRRGSETFSFFDMTQIILSTCRSKKFKSAVYEIWECNVKLLLFLHANMNPSELEFLAEKEIVEIVPKFTLDTICLMEGNLGPFRAGLPVRVPLWVALDFRRRERCTLVPPDWMNIQALEAIKKEEKTNELFTKMPNEHYMAVTVVICRSCSQDIPDSDRVQVLVKDIWDNRIAKIRTAIDSFIKTGSSFAKVNNLTQMEIANVRPFFPHALEQIHRMRQNSQEALINLNNSKSQSQSDSMYPDSDRMTQ
ncbi:DNA replication complex GINS protein PSF2 isoform X1 [Folsomia candida]|nr:DNA replication complex GINS protein PSF2 isoform X1 [Folsomia candida]